MLNMLNRLVTVLSLLTLIACALLVAVGVYLPPLVREQAADAARFLFLLPDTMFPMQQLITLGVAALVVLLAFVLLLLELRPTHDEVVRVRAADGGETTIARAAIHQRVQFAVDRLEEVIIVEPRIRGSGKGLIVDLDVVTSPYVDVPQKSEEIRAVARAVVEKEMGIPLKRVVVRLDHEGYDAYDAFADDRRAGQPG